MTDALMTRDAYRMQQWSQVIRECRESGLTNKEFCRQHGISEKTFYYWLKKLRTALVEQAVPEIVPLDEGRSTADQDMLHIEFGRSSLTVPGKTDVAAIAQLLRALQDQC